MKKIFYIICLSVVLCSCNKFVDIPFPIDGLSRAQVFTDDNRATTTVTSIYGNMINTNTFASFQTTLFGALSSDEIAPFNVDFNFEQISENEIAINNVQTASIWASAYKTIFLTNSVIEGVDASTQVSEGTKKRLRAECRFLRAFCYFYLINFYGDVPLLNTSDYKINGSMPRHSMNNIYDFILSELLAVKDDLAVEYIANEKFRPNKWTAVSLLARVHLYRSEWKKAEEAASQVINSGVYTPLEPLGKVFLKNSREAIWQLMPNKNGLTELLQFKPSGSIPTFYLRPGLMNDFEGDDLRRKVWIDSINYLSAKYFYPGKYKNTTSAISEYYMIFRVSELYLIRAEALGMQAKLTDAVTDLNTVRQRANLPALSTSLTKEEVINAVADERRLELFCEWGHRWFDLKRTGKSDQILASLKSKWQTTDQLYPIPLEEMIANINLTQNPGY